MKRSNIMITGAAAVVALVAVSGIALGAFAQSNTTDTQNTTGASGQMRMHKWENLSEADRAKLDADFTARKAEMAAKRTELNDAMKNGYAAWVEAVKKNIGDTAPILSQVNESNFSKFVEGHNLMEQGRTILAGLGIERGIFGKGGGPGMGKGMGMH
jgi:hypothetical protein